jgi:AcrR family transcriptional regulator
MVVHAPPPDATIRRQVLAHAHGLLREDPRVPIERIAREAGVSRATLYRHFGSRAALLRAVELDPPASATDRALTVAADLVARSGLAGVSMDDVAAAAGVSRATLYRLFPSKAALFGALLRRYSPFEPVLAILDEIGDRPPREVIGRIGLTVASIGQARIELLRAAIADVGRAGPDAIEGVRDVIGPTIGRLAAYLSAQMAAGRLRPMQPLLAVQAVIGPIAFHLLVRTPSERIFGFDRSIEESVAELVESILAGMEARP